jgi:hypothetical protein
VELAVVKLAGHLLSPDQKIKFDRINKDCKELIFDLVYKILGVKQPNFKAFLRPDLSNGRLVMLGHCLAAGSGEVSAIKTHVMSQLEADVLDDKQPKAVAEARIAYYYPLLAWLSKGEVESQILPQIQFIMNRTKQFVGVVALLIQGLKTY